MTWGKSPVEGWQGGEPWGALRADGRAAYALAQPRGRQRADPAWGLLLCPRRGQQPPAARSERAALCL